MNTHTEGLEVDFHRGNVVLLVVKTWKLALKKWRYAEICKIGVQAKTRVPSLALRARNVLKECLGCTVAMTQW